MAAAVLVRLAMVLAACAPPPGRCAQLPPLPAAPGRGRGSNSLPIEQVVDQLEHAVEGPEDLLQKDVGRSKRSAPFSVTSRMLQDSLLNNAVFVYAFDYKVYDQMQHVVFSLPYSFKHHIVMSETLSKTNIGKAFDQIAQLKPMLAVWLLPFKDGDEQFLLSDLAKGFAQTRAHSRHGVFHWPPERCDSFNVNPQRVASAYEHVDFVFQFGYQDERLSAMDPSKFMPWPLGTAAWRGWRAPAATLPLSQREHLAVFRGSSGTRNPRDLEMLSELFRIDGRSDIVLESRDGWSPKESAESVGRYRYLLASAKYALSPAGHNPNCYRIEEAVESGAIPVIVLGSRSRCYDNWSALYGNPIENRTNFSWIPPSPFKLLHSWHELPLKLDELEADATDDAGQRLQKWLERWRHAFHQKFDLTVLNVLLDVMRQTA